MHYSTALLIAASCGTAWIGYRSWKLPPFPGRQDFLIMQAAGSWWAIAAALETASVTLETKVFWAEMAWLGIVLAPSFWALFVWTYVKGETSALTPFLRLIPFGLAGVTWLTALSNDAHHLIYSVTQLSGPELGAPVIYTHGPGFYAVTVYLYIAMLLTVIIAISAFTRASAFYRGHYVGLLGAIALPWIANISYVTQNTVVFGFDPTPFTFLAMAGILYWLIARRQLFDLLPIAQDALLDALPDAVLVLDRNNTVVEMNKAAATLAEICNLSLGDQLSKSPVLERVVSPLFVGQADAAKNVVFHDTHRYYELTYVPLRYDERLCGRMLISRDVTQARMAEQKLQETLQALQEELRTNTRLQHELREQAVRDPLTGLYNRRYYEEIQTKLLAQADLKRHRLAVVLIDMDHFKLLNDQYGHEAGDEVLRAMGLVLRRGIGAEDLVCRIGGEEILVVLVNATAEQAVSRVEEWRKAVRAIEFSFRSPATTVTFSAGIAAYPDDALDWNQLMQRADVALYQAKSNGRDRSVCWEAVNTRPSALLH